EKRDAVRERKVRAAVERHELLPGESENGADDLAVRAGRAFDDLGVREEGGVKTYRLIRLPIKHKKGSDLLHRSLPLVELGQIRVEAIESRPPSGDNAHVFVLLAVIRSGMGDVEGQPGSAAQILEQDGCHHALGQI